LPEEKRKELWYGVPGLLDWYLEGKEF